MITIELIMITLLMKHLNAVLVYEVMRLRVSEQDSTVLKRLGVRCRMEIL